MSLGALRPHLEPPRYELPFSGLWPFLSGLTVGIVLRLGFMGSQDDTFTAMAGSFILVMPFVVGMVTVYVAERYEPRTWKYYAMAPAISVTAVVVGCFLALIEGLICAVMALPLFWALAALGGLVMGWVSRRKFKPGQTVACFAMLPFALAPLEGQVVNPVRIDSVQRSVVVAAPPEAVWQQIQDTRAIRPEEVQHGWIYRIGVPLPISGVTEQTPEGPVRRVRMGKDIHFDQVPVEFVPGRHVLWKYRFAEDSFPPRALDDHVRIGGRYFDLRNTAYTLAPVAGGTRVTVSMEYRVSTRFNWYVDPLAQLLIGNVEEVLLDFYKARSEAAS